MLLLCLQETSLKYCLLQRSSWTLSFLKKDVFLCMTSLPGLFHPKSLKMCIFLFLIDVSRSKRTFFVSIQNTKIIMSMEHSYSRGRNFFLPISSSQWCERENDDEKGERKSPSTNRRQFLLSSSHFIWMYIEISS